MKPIITFKFWSDLTGVWLRLGLVVVISLVSAPALWAETGTNAPPPATPQDLFNAGTRQLSAGKLTGAEELLQDAVASQNAQAQPKALYNLGCVRVAQGAEILKNSKDGNGKATKPHVDNLTAAATDASRQIDEAIASQNEQQMIMAYLRGGGVRREINEATKAVRQALDDKKEVLAKWQRAAGDFRSAAELQSHDTDASFNAAATERAIAALIDKLNKLQDGAMKMKAAGRMLGDKLQKLKGMIPAPNMPPGAPGDEDDEDMPGMKPGEQEGAGKNGDEMKISPEEAEQLLNGYKLGGTHPLPMWNESTNKPANHTGKIW